MTVTRADATDRIAGAAPELLLEILESADVSPRGAQSGSELAERLTEALWMAWSTPLGYVVRDVTLEAIVDDVGRKLSIPLPAGDAWEKLRALRATLGLNQPVVEVSDLPEPDQKRLKRSWGPTAACATSAGGAYGAGRVGAAVVRFGQSPVGRLLPNIPPLAPWWKAIHNTGRVASKIGNPAAFGLGALAVNYAMGTNYQRVIPLLLGLGATTDTQAWAVDLDEVILDHGEFDD